MILGTLIVLWASGAFRVHHLVYDDSVADALVVAIPGRVFLPLKPVVLFFEGVCERLRDWGKR